MTGDPHPCPTVLPRPGVVVFRDRCSELGLATWRCDLTGSMIAKPAARSVGGDWLGSPTLGPHIERVARAGLDASSTAWVELFDGCWLLALPDDAMADRQGVTVVMALGPQALEMEMFEAVCAAAVLSPEKARYTLAPMAQYHGRDLDRLAKTLRWAHADLIQADLHHRALGEFSEKLAQAYEEVNLLFSLAHFSEINASPLETVRSACRQIHGILPFKWLAIGFDDRRGVLEDFVGQWIFAGTLSCDYDAFRSAAQGLVGRDQAQHLAPLLEQDRDTLAALVDAQVIFNVITHNQKAIGVLLAGNKYGLDPEVTSGDIQFLDAAAGFLSVFHENTVRFEEQRTMFFGTLQALTASIDAKDHYTHGHSQRVAYLATRLVEAMGWDHPSSQCVRIAGLVHDVGKIGVPEAILCKQGTTTPQEARQLQRHPMIGYQILKDIPPMQDALPGVLYHHERWDGQGYPHGLRSEAIPLLGRIIALADAFDAMSSDRSYRAAITRDQVLAEITRYAGTQFDPELAQRFVGLDFSGYDGMLSQHQAKTPINHEPAC